MKKCPYCAEDIQDSAIKCRFCGEDLKENTTEIPMLSEIKFHLEFIGYECQYSEDKKFLICKSASRSNMIVNLSSDQSVVYFSARYRLGDTNKVVRSLEFYKHLDIINSKTSLSKRYSEEDSEGDVVINIDGHINGYEKKLFNNILDSFEGEVNNHVRSLNDFTK